MRQNICGILCALCSQVGHMRNKVIIMSDSKAKKIEWFRVMDIKKCNIINKHFCFSLVPQLESELEQCERESAELQEYANSVLQQIADHCPDILEQVVNALEESCWPDRITELTLPASPSLSSVFHLISQNASTQTLVPSPTCTNQRTDTYGKDWQLTSRVHAWISFGVWERWAFLLPSPTTTFIPSAPSQSRLHSHKHGEGETERGKRAAGKLSIIRHVHSFS